MAPDGKDGNAPADPFLQPGASTNTISASASWKSILAAEGLAATATADTAKTEVGTQALGNISLTTTKLKHVTFASDGNYEYYGETFPSATDGGQTGEAWNAAWMGDQYGC